jgi:hypothetical protein
MGRDDESLAIVRDAMNSGLLKGLYLNLGLLARRDEELAFKVTTNHEFALRDWRHHDRLYDAFRNPGTDHSETLASLREFIEANPDRDPWFLEPVLLRLGYLDFARAPIGTWGDDGSRYRQSQQFRNYARQAGILQYWRETEFPGLCRPVGGDDFECD